MQTQKKIMATKDDRLSDLPDSILIHILSMLRKREDIIEMWDSKAVVRTSILSSRWRFLWMSVPVSLAYVFPEDSLDYYVASIHRELYYWKSCEKIRSFIAWGLNYEERYAKDIDLWVHFATKVANVEEFSLGIFPESHQKYEFPQFAYKNTRLRELTLRYCQLNPYGSVHWSSFVSLSIGFVQLTDGVMKNVLSGCPNLECLDLCGFWGIQRLEISSVKLRKLKIRNYISKNHDPWLEIVAPYIQYLELSGGFSEIRIRQRNVASLVTAVFDLFISFEGEERNLENECSYLKELLHSIAHAENLELSACCIKCMSILELKGWHFPPSSRKLLQLAATLNQLEFPGICSFLQSSSDLETLVISGSVYSSKSSELLSKYTNEDEQSRKFETHYFNCSLLHLKTIKFIDCFGPPSINKSVLLLVKYLLKHATVLEKFFITDRYKKSDVSEDFVKMKQELLSFPRSSPHASVIFC